MASAGSVWAPDRGEVVMVNLAPRGAKEARMEMAMVVLSPKVFNERTGLVIGLPVGLTEAHETNPFAVKFVGENGVACYVLSHQPKSLDWRECDARPHPWMQVAPEAFLEASEGLNQIIQLGG